MRAKSGNRWVELPRYLTYGKLIKRVAAIDMIYHKSDMVMIPSPIAILKKASTVKEAQAFERFVLSQSGEE